MECRAELTMPTYLRSAAVLVALPFVLLSCSSPGEAPNGAAGPNAGGRGGGRGAGAPVPVVTARVAQKAMPVTLPAVGTVEAISSVQIRAQVTGQLSAVHFTEGQEVRQGQPLFSLDSRSFQAAVQQAEAVLARDTATLLNAQAQQARLESLFQRGLIAREPYDTQRASATALAATVEADKAALETARVNLQYTEIKAPISGRTGALGAHVGDLVRSSDSTPLIVINQLSPVYVSFAVPGRHLADIRRFQAQKPLSLSAVVPSATLAADQATSRDGGRAAATPESAAALVPPGRPAAARGVVSFIDNAVDQTTGNIRLKGTFPNADHQLWPGAFVQVTLDLTTTRDALVVPATAVQASQDGQYVYVVKGDRTVEMRPVRVDRQQGAETVVAGGVAAGEEVVADGHLRLTPGARVVERGARGARGRE